MIRNQSGQAIGAQMTNATTGADFAGTVTVYVTIDAGTQTIGSVGSGLCTSEGNGYYTYAPAAAETDGNLIAFTFKGTGAITATIQVATVTATQNAAISSSTGANVFTVRQLIKLALLRVNVLQVGANPEGAQLADAFTLLNLDALSIERLMIPFVLRSLFTITSTKGTPTNPYTVGPGGDINIPKPTIIDYVNYVNNAVTPANEIPLMPMTSGSYSGISQKSLTSSLPGSWYYQPTYAAGLGSLYLYTIPTQSSLQGVLYAPSAVAQFSSVNDSVIVPAGYKKFLVDGLAVELGLMFRENIPVDPELKNSVRSMKLAIKAVNVPSLDMGFDPAWTSAGYRDNIYNGWPS